MGVRRWVAEGLLLYKRLISPLLPRACRYSPTCSEYMRLVVLEHGIVHGLFLGLWRLARCHPLNPGGIDLP